MSSAESHSAPPAGDPPRREVTRLAPSPTGALHLGNARTFLVNWLQARQRGWRIVLRIEDLDGPRVKAGADRQAIELLEWLGLDWDEGPIYQSHDLEPYRNAMRELASGGLAYPSDLTRREIEESSSAPHEGHELRVGPELRPELCPREFDVDASRGWRFVTPDRSIDFEDRFKGPCSCAPFQEIGDFAIWTKEAQPAYQLAVVVDDHRQGVTQVVRGDDLLTSTGRQSLVREGLALGAAPAHWHLPMVVGEDGRRLAKRHGDTRLLAYRDRGVGPQRVLGLLAGWCGAIPARSSEIDARELLDVFDVASMPGDPIVFGAEDDAWLSHSN